MTGREEKTELGVKPADTPVTEVAEPASLPGVSQAASLLMGVKLPIRVRMGSTQMRLRDITQLGTGSVVELDCSPDDPVEIVVNDRVIAQGEIVVVAGNYGVRITRIADGAEGNAPNGDTDLLRLSERLK